jgi:hypothetical protein
MERIAGARVLPLTVMAGQACRTRTEGTEDERVQDDQSIVSPLVEGRGSFAAAMDQNVEARMDDNNGIQKQRSNAGSGGIA